MKKLVLFFIVITFSITFVRSQVVNGNFESWNSTSYSEPSGWSTGNQNSISNTGVAPVTMVQGVTGNAVRMETMVIGNDTAQAYIANGDPMSGTGGIPCNQQPTAITGYYRYNLPNNDTALILIMFKSNGSIISNDIIKIKGTGTQNTFTSFSFPVTVPSTPDSVIVAFTCSNLIDNVGVEAGSWLEVDGISFSNPNVAIPGSSFESWVNESYDVASQWESSGDAVKTTDAFEGNFAIKLTTVDYGNGDISSGSITNGQFTNNGPPTGGIPFSEMADTLTGYYKYNTSGADTASVNITVSNNGNWVGGSGVSLTSTATYTYFEIPIWCSSTPDMMRIDASSSRWPYTQSSAGSTLYLDNLVLKSTLALSTKNVKFNNSVSVYPNPATDVLNINLNDNQKNDVVITILDMAGRTIQSETFPGSMKMKMNVSSLSEGLYICNIQSGNSTVQKIFAK